MTLLLVCAACVAAGAFGSMVGLGGGLVIIPVLSQVLGYDIKVTIAASLIGVIAGSISASPRFLGAGIADRRLAVTLLVATVAGGLAGGLTASFLDDRVLAFLFATLLMMVAIHMAIGLRSGRRATAPPGSAPPGSAPTDGRPASRERRPATAAFDTHYVEPRTGEAVPYGVRRLGPALGVSFVAGNISGLLGVGGGVINVPTMTSLMGVPLRVATTTSTLMLGATAEQRPGQRRGRSTRSAPGRPRRGGRARGLATGRPRVHDRARERAACGLRGGGPRVRGPDLSASAVSGTRRTRASRRTTRAVFHAGTLAGGACLLLAMVLEMVGRPATTASLVDLRAIVSGVLTGDPWGWSALGVWIVIATPGVALATTALEFRAIADRWAVRATLGVLGLLALSLAVGLVRGS